MTDLISQLTREFEEKFVEKPSGKNIQTPFGERILLPPYKIKGTPNDLKSFLEQSLKKAYSQGEKAMLEKVKKVVPEELDKWLNQSWDYSITTSCSEHLLNELTKLEEETN